MLSEAELHAFHVGRIISTTLNIIQPSSTSDPSPSTHTHLLSVPTPKAKRRRRTAEVDGKSTSIAEPKLSKKARPSLPAPASRSSWATLPVRMRRASSSGSITSLIALPCLECSKISRKARTKTQMRDSAAIPPPSPRFDILDAATTTPLISTRRWVAAPMNDEGYDQLLSSCLRMPDSQDSDTSNASFLVPSSPIASPVTRPPNKTKKKMEEKMEEKMEKSKGLQVCSMPQKVGEGTTTEEKTPGEKRRKRASVGGVGKEKTKQRKGGDGPTWVVHTPSGPAPSLEKD